MIPRSIQLPNRSFFLFGPRQTGKNTLLQERLGQPENFRVNLLNSRQERRYFLDPQMLEFDIAGLETPPPWVIIDEVQKVPKILDVVHDLMESKGLRFALTGSSARKLKRDGANMLAGRAFIRNLHPFTHRELGAAFRLEDAMRFGTLPPVCECRSEAEKIELLQAYTTTYLKEEIILEQLIRKLDPFRRFLEISAQCNGQIINLARLGRECGVSGSVIGEYFKILEDTLVGFLLPGFHESLRKRQSAAPKFYLFDPGVKQALEQTLHLPLEERSFGFGNTFEHWMVLEIKRLAEYAGKDWRYSHLRTYEGNEIDLIIDLPGEARHFIEIKSTTRIDRVELEFLSSIRKDSRLPGEAICVSRDPHRMRIDNVLCLPWTELPGFLGI